MKIRPLVFALAVPALLALVLAGSSRGEMSGDRGRPIVMQGALSGPAGDRCHFSIEIERVGFLLNTVQGRYRLVRLRFENLDTRPIDLSPDTDRLEAEVAGGEPVPAMLDPQSADSPFWDGLSTDLREILAYPARVKARVDAPGASPQIVYLYALFPADRVTAVPAAFTYTIASLGQPVRLEHRAAAARP